MTVLATDSRCVSSSFWCIRLTLGALALLGATVPAQAELWNVYGGVALDVEYSDNKQLATNMPDEGFQAIADVDINAARVTRNHQILAQAELQAVRYDGIEVLNDEENVVLRLSGEHKASRNLAFGWRGQYARDTTSNRQPRVNVQVDESSGFNVDTALTREQFRTRELLLGPNVTWQASEKLRLNAAYVYREVNFPERATTDFNFFDHEQNRVQLTADYALSSRHSVSLSATGSQFESSRRIEDGTLSFLVEDIETDTLGGSLGYRYDVSKTVYFGAQAGLQNLDTTADSGSFDSDGTEFVYRVFAVSRGEKNRLLVSFGRSVEASGVGRLLESDLARLVYRYRLGPRQTLLMRATYLSNKPIGTLDERLDRKFFTIEPGFSYAFSRKLNAGVNYRYRNRELRSEGTESDNHSISVNLEYRFGQQRSQ